MKSQLNDLKSAQTELNRAAQAADQVLTDGLGKEVNDVSLSLVLSYLGDILCMRNR